MITEEEQQSYGPMIRDIMTELRKGEDGDYVAATLGEVYGFGYETAARLVEKCYTILMEDEEASILDMSDIKRPH